MRRIRLRIGLVLGVACALVLVVAATALGWRLPTGRERTAITAAAAAVSHAGQAKVNVSHIRVSTVGPWASARDTIYLHGQPDTAIDVLRRRHGRWRSVSLGTAGEWCVMPQRDRRNLGFPAGYPCPRR